MASILDIPPLSIFLFIRCFFSAKQRKALFLCPPPVLLAKIFTFAQVSMILGMSPGVLFLLLTAVPVDHVKSVNAGPHLELICIALYMRDI